MPAPSRLSPTQTLVIASMRVLAKEVMAQEVAEYLQQKTNTIYQCLRDLEVRELVVRQPGQRAEGQKGPTPELWALADEDTLQAFEEAQAKGLATRRVEIVAGGQVSKWEQIFLRETEQFCVNLFFLIKRSRGGFSSDEIAMAYGDQPIGYTRSIGALVQLLAESGMIEFTERKKWRADRELDRQILWDAIVEARRQEREKWQGSKIGSEIDSL